MRLVYLLCLIFSCGGLGVAVGDGDWNCQERLLWDIPLSDIQWRSLSCSAISLSSCTSPGGSREYLAASLATSSRHSTTFRGWPCRTVKRSTMLYICIVIKWRNVSFRYNMGFIICMYVITSSFIVSDFVRINAVPRTVKKKAFLEAAPRHARLRRYVICVTALFVFDGN